MWINSLLVGLVGVPAIGAICVCFCPQKATKIIRVIGGLFSVAVVVIWLLLWGHLSQAEQILFRFGWLTEFGVGLHFGLDHAGSLIAGVIAIVAVFAQIGTSPSVTERSRVHVVCLLLVEAGMLGVVTSWDLIMFIVFWEVTLMPLFILMGLGPDQRGVTAASRFFISSVISSVLMWIGVLLVVKMAGAPKTFDLLELSNRLQENRSLLTTTVWLFAPAFLVRMAAVPLHTWFPQAVSSVPPAASIMLAGGMLPLSGYGFLHILCGLFGPDLGGVNQWFMWIGLITGLGCGVASVVQRDLKSMLAYVLLSQIGLAIVGFSLPGGRGYPGGVMMLVAIGLSGAALFLFAGVVCRARTSQRIIDISGLWRVHPAFVGLVFASVASLAAVPGTVGFVGLTSILVAASDNIVVTLIGIGTVLVAGGAILWVHQRINGGSFHQEMWTGGHWPYRKQTVILGLIAILILIGGIVPGLISRPYNLNAQAIQSSNDNDKITDYQNGDSNGDGF
jgi:NADH-quinone oxidoreductase subunit M